MRLADWFGDAYPVWMNRMLVSMTLVILGLLSAGSVWAQEASGSDVVYQENTVLTFGDDTIDGSLSRPDGQLKAAKSYDTNGSSVFGAHFAVDFYSIHGLRDSCSRLRINVEKSTAVFVVSLRIDTFNI